jgi:peptide/nickel transport system permease protein
MASDVLVAGSSARAVEQRPAVRRLPAAGLRFCRRQPLAAFGGVIVLLLILLAIVGPTIAPHRYDSFIVRARLQGPSSSHWFGTDDKGRDVFSRVLYGARVTVVIGFGATALATAIAGTIGILSGYFGGATDTIIQRFIEIWQSFPALIFLIFIVAIFKPSTASVLITIGLLFSAGTSRVVRGTTLSVRGQSYIEATRATGASSLRIMLRHVLPNVAPVMLVVASVQIGAVILIEASLSFLGFGVPPPHPTWGAMLQDAQRFMQHYPHLAIFPGAAIAVVVYSFNMLGDGIRDEIDPRLRGRRN